MAEVLLTGPTSVDFVLQHGRAVLDAVHSVRHGVQAVSSSLSGLDWPTVAEQLPHHGAVDVAIAVERCGSTDVVRNRLEVLGAIIKAMAARERRMPGMVRVAVISYTDHDARHGRPPSDRPCDVVRFDAPEAVQDIVSGWEPVTMRSNYGTSSEDALNEASKLEWRAPALRSFVIIGSRPPSVRSMGGTYAVICPQDLDGATRLELKTLRAMEDVRTIAVTDPVPWQKYSQARHTGRADQDRMGGDRRIRAEVRSGGIPHRRARGARHSGSGRPVHARHAGVGSTVIKPSDRGTQLAVWGGPNSGKTTFLLLLPRAARQKRWTYTALDQASQEWLREAKELLDEKLVPLGTDECRRISLKVERPSRRSGRWWRWHEDPVLGRHDPHGRPARR